MISYRVTKKKITLRLKLVFIFPFPVTLHDIVHTDKSLTLVFEYLEKDLKQYMDDCGAILSMNNVKLFLFQVIYIENKFRIIHLFTAIQKLRL